MTSERGRGFQQLEWTRVDADDARRRATQFHEAMKTRRSVRDFSPEPIPDALLDLAIATAGTAPSGANRQPWRFVVVKDPAVKRRIRVAAEEEERAFYSHRAPDEWLEALAPLGTDAHKPFLEVAPALIVVFRQDYTPGVDEAGHEVHHKHYYVPESVGIAVGLLLASLRQAGLATLTHTPSPMGFLGEVLGRPKHERAYVLIPVGYPAAGAQVPVLDKKPLDELRVVV